MEKYKPQETIKHQIQLTTTKQFELLKPAEAEGNTGQEGEGTAPTQIFVLAETNRYN
jgi:hypothetical protein